MLRRPMAHPCSDHQPTKSGYDRPVCSLKTIRERDVHNRVSLSRVRYYSDQRAHLSGLTSVCVMEVVGGVRRCGVR